MTFAELAARYRLVTKSRSDGVESWEATRVETEQAVNVHLLVTTRQISILEMMAHLDPAGRARIVEQLVVDEVPVVVTEPLPPSTTFMEWLQNNVPSTVTSVIRPLSRPKTQQTPQASAPPASAPESLTMMFLAAGSEAAASEASTPAVSPSRPEVEHVEPPAAVTPSTVPAQSDASVETPANEPEVRRTTPPTPLAKLAGGLTDIFSASELLSKLDPESTVKRGAVSVPAPPPVRAPVTPTPTSTPTPTPTPTPKQTPIVPITEAQSTPAPPPASREIEPFALGDGFADIPDFRSEPIQPERSGHPPAGDEDLLDAEPPRFETTFVTPLEPNKAPPKQPQLNPPRPKLGPTKSSYTAVIEGRVTPGMPANPALIAPPPPPSRQPSILPVVIMVGLLVVAIIVIILVVKLKG